MWDEISKYDVLTVYHDVDGEEVRVQGEVTNKTSTQMVIRDDDGAYHVIHTDNLIDIDNHVRASRDEDEDMYSGSPDGYYLYS